MSPVPGGEKIPAPKDSTPGKAMPKGDKEAQLFSPMGREVTPVSAPMPARKGTPSPFELNRRYEPRADHAPDFSWITGQLSYVHADGGLLVLRYAPVSKEDKNGGSVVLARDLSMESYREGDLVTIRGQLLDHRASLFLAGPQYQARSISLVERGN